MNRIFITVVAAAALVGCGTMTPAKQSDLRYQKVHQVDLPKSEIFSRTEEWFAKTFVDSKSVLEVVNEETGKIIGKGRTEISPTGLVGIPVRMTITVEVKPERYRITFDDYTGYYGDYRTNPSRLTDSRSVAQTNERIRDMDNGLLEYLKSTKSSDDW